MTEAKETPKASEQEDPKAKALRVEQDSRVAREKAEAEAKGGGPGKPEPDLNQDG